MSEPGRLHVKLLMPLAPPQAGGATEYARLLCKYFTAIGRVASVELLTQQTSTAPKRTPAEQAARFQLEGAVLEKLTVRPELTVVFGLAAPKLVRAMRWTKHQAEVADALARWHRLASAMELDERTVVLIHSAYSRQPTNFVSWQVWRLQRRRSRKLTYVLDVRDPLNEASKLKRYAGFDGAIGCSWEIVRQLREVWPATRVGELPVPFEGVALDEGDVDAVVAAHGLTRGRYVLGPGGIVTLKGFERLFDAWRCLVNDGINVPLVTVGRRREVGRDVESAMQQEPGLMHLGEVPRREVLALMAGAGVVVLPSLPGVEGVPRAALEGLSVGAVGLWPATREFVEAMPGSVAADEVEALADQMRAALDGDPAVGRGGYDWRRHEASTVAGQYVAWLGAVSGLDEAADE